MYINYVCFYIIYVYSACTYGIQFNINERTRLMSNNNLFTEERLNALISLKNKMNINLKINVT